MKNNIFITTAILIFILFASCSSTTSSKCESNCFKVHEDKSFGGKRYEIVTYEDSVSKLSGDCYKSYVELVEKLKEIQK